MCLVIVLNRILIGVLPNIGVELFYCCFFFFFHLERLAFCHSESWLVCLLLFLNYFGVIAFLYSVLHSVDLSMDKVCIL